MSRVDETIPAAWSEVLAERRRQVEVEIWTPAHDDKHTRGEIALAAACYAMWAALAHRGAASRDRARDTAQRWWPWNWSWWKPTDRRRDLVKAGALILAEIERLDRASAKGGSDAQG